MLIDMFNKLQRWRDSRHARMHPLPDALWARASQLPALRHLDDADRAKLRARVPLFLRDKTFFGTHGLVVTPWMKTRIGTEACLPALHISPFHYPGFATIVLYETAFVASREQVDDIGVVHVGTEEMTGESWEQGPVILSWQDIEECAEDNGNLVLHEFAHKLDCLRGDMNGCPPLPQAMSYHRWREAFTQAYDRACADVAAGRDPGIDVYATDAPAEFFAVVMEAFFMTPQALRDRFPQVYEQMSQWLQQDTASGAPPDAADCATAARADRSFSRGRHGSNHAGVGRRRPGLQK